MAERLSMFKAVLARYDFNNMYVRNIRREEALQLDNGSAKIKRHLHVSK
jgi:hypothetical protein